MYLRRKSLIHEQENEKTRHLAIVYKRTPFPRPFGKNFLIPHSNHVQTTSWSVDHPQKVSSKKLFSRIFLFSNQSAVTNLTNTHKQPTTNSQSLQQEGDIQPRPKLQLTNKQISSKMGCCSSRTAGSQSQHRNVRPVRAGPNQTRQAQFAHGLQWAHANRRDPEAVESHIGGWVDGIKQCPKGERGCSSHRCSRQHPTARHRYWRLAQQRPKAMPQRKGQGPRVPILAP